jgi:rSAM/selenodomain-associated transferase 1
MRRNLIVFLRYPEAGKAKTRLISELGAEGAAVLARELAERTLNVAEAAAADGNFDVSVWYTGCDESRAREIAPGNFSYHEQIGSDLGTRMNAAFKSTFADGYQQVALIGTDCPELDESIIHEAFEVLTDADVCIGPVTDGGYYLIALKAPAPGLFDGISWGSDQVLETTVRAVDTLGLSAEGLPLLWDVDRPEDLIDYELYKTREDCPA